MDLEQALQKCLDINPVNEHENIPVQECLYRVCAESVYSPFSIPGFNRSLVDGYAIRAEDWNNLQKGRTIELEIMGVVPAGTIAQPVPFPGKCWWVMTGAPVPYGAAAVIRQEDGCIEGNRVRIESKIDHKKNIQSRGDIIQEAQLIVSRGQDIKLRTIEKVASSGVTSIKVFRKPRVYIINSGSELRLPGELLESGQIYNSNLAFFINKVREARCIPVVGTGLVSDNKALIIKEIEKGLELSDLIIVTGGSGGGKYDLVLSAIKSFNVEILFTGLKVKPGRSTAAAVTRSKLIVNIPGNPGAGEIIFDVLINPVLMKTRGLNQYENRWINVRLGQDLALINERLLCRADIFENNGQLIALQGIKRPVQNPLVIGDAILDLKPGTNKDDMVKALVTWV